jgi:hypothetical protein
VLGKQQQQQQHKPPSAAAAALTFRAVAAFPIDQALLWRAGCNGVAFDAGEPALACGHWHQVEVFLVADHAALGIDAPVAQK